MAPEQMSGAHDVDARADMFAVGAVLYELLTGSVPHGALSWPSEERPELGTGWDDLVRSAMDRSPAKRPGSAAAMRERLDGAWRAQQGRETQLREEMEREARKEAEKRAREAADRQAREEAERLAREEADRRTREDAENQAREEAERKSREEAERRTREEAQRKAREETEKRAQESAQGRDQRQAQGARARWVSSEGGRRERGTQDASAGGTERATRTRAVGLATNGSTVTHRTKKLVENQCDCGVADCAWSDRIDPDPQGEGGEASAGCGTGRGSTTSAGGSARGR